MRTLKITSIDIQKTGKILFILFTAALTSTILLFYSYLLKDIIPPTNLLREYFICFGQIAFQAMMILWFDRKFILLDYLFQMMTVSLLGGLLLLPVIVSSLIFFPFSPGSIYYAAYFLFIVLIMFFEHKRRVKKMKAPHWLTNTWVLYRLIILFTLI